MKAGIVRGRPVLTVSPGDRFGRWTVKEYGQTSLARVRCVCDCGTAREVALERLFDKKEPSRSCGCARLEKITKHGHTGNRWSARSSGTYNSWQGIIERCTNPRGRAYERYGARGIVVCARWDPAQGGSFENFLADMGERPEWAVGGIDRIDGTKGYESSNCRWATVEQQMENRRLHTGSRFPQLNDMDWLQEQLVSLTVQEIARALGCERTAVYDAIRRNGLESPRPVGKAQHVQWHVRRGIHKEGCRWCEKEGGALL